MHALLAYMEAELPAVNAHLEQCVARLHHTVQPQARYVLEAGGKRLRPMLTLLSHRALGGGQTPSPYAMASALELLHSATLLHDDILDGADLRRGRPAAHHAFGAPVAILAGDALLALGNLLVAEYGDARLTQCVSEAIMATATGEIREIAHVGDMALESDVYLEIITGKTAYLIEAATRGGALLAGADDATTAAAADFGRKLGVAFQLVDDALDYGVSEAQAGKTVAADLREGKVTLPLIFYREAASDADRAALFAMGESLRNASGELAPETAEAVQRVVASIRASDAVARTRAVAAEHAHAARASLAALPPGTERDLLGLALDYVVNRTK